MLEPDTCRGGEARGATGEMDGRDEDASSCCKLEEELAAGNVEGAVVTAGVGVERASVRRVDDVAESISKRENGDMASAAAAG